MTLFREIDVTIRSYQIVGTRNVVTHTDMARLSLLCWAAGIFLERLVVVHQLRTSPRAQ